MIGRPIAGYLTPTKIIGKMIVIVQYVIVRNLSEVACFSDLFIIISASNPQPTPKHCIIPTMMSKYAQR